MPLTIEDGTGVTGADSFATEAELDTTRANVFEASDGDTAGKEAALRRAYLFMRSLPWLTDCEFPTFGGTIPADIKTAQGIFAHYEMANPQGLQPSVVPGQQKILTQVGDIGWTPTGQTGVDAQRGQVTMAMDLLKSYLDGSGSTTFIKRG